jgi:hypothetical protein
MIRLLTAILLSVAFAPASFARSGPERPGAQPSTRAAASPAAGDPAPVDTVPTSDTLYQAIPPLPPLPGGESTVIGGLIGAVDPVQDILTLDVYGGHPMKIYFDERTHFYRDGRKTPLSDLKPEERASVETVLDGTDVYALSVHMLTRTPQGECQGQILRYDANRGVLTVRNSLSGVPIELHVEPSTKIARVGQPTFMSQGEGLGDLRRGALASIQFEPDNQGSGIADHISILAIPGSDFEFSGKVTWLDMHTADIALLDPRDGNSYTIYFSPALFPQARNLHNGSKVRVTASFDGHHYVASTMTIQ